MTLVYQPSLTCLKQRNHENDSVRRPLTDMISACVCVRRDNYGIYDRRFNYNKRADGGRICTGCYRSDRWTDINMQQIKSRGITEMFFCFCQNELQSLN